MIDNILGDFGNAKHFHIHTKIGTFNLKTYGILLVQESYCKVEILNGIPNIEKGTYHPEFGTSISNDILTVGLSKNYMDIILLWQ